MTLDIETYLEDIMLKNKKHKKHNLLCICYNDYKNSYSYYRADYKTSEE